VPIAWPLVSLPRYRILPAQTLVRGTGIESVTACETASLNLLSPNFRGDVDIRRLGRAYLSGQAARTPAVPAVAAAFRYLREVLSGGWLPLGDELGTQLRLRPQCVRSRISGNFQQPTVPTLWPACFRRSQRS
jgi:hypothetical protein